MNYFRLNPEIYLFDGSGSSILCNVLNGDIIALDARAAEQLKKAEANLPLDNDALFDELVDLGWMQKYDKAVFVDKIRYTNAFNKKRSWKNTPPIENVIIQVTNRCDESCDKRNCTKSFCPMCTVTNKDHEDLDFKAWKKIIDQLQVVHTGIIVLLVSSLMRQIAVIMWRKEDGFKAC